jgi:branched-chain amino acid transport system permease protein
LEGIDELGPLVAGTKGNGLHETVQSVISGIGNGGVLALLTFGLVLVFKATDILNLAHAEIAMFAAFIGVVYLAPNQPILVVLVAMLAVGGAMGLATEQLVVRPLKKADEWTVIVATLTVGLMLLGLAGLVWGYNDRFFPYVAGVGTVHFGSYLLTNQQVVTLGVVVALALTSAWFFKRTRVGVAMRGVASNPMAAELVGARVRALKSGTWIAGGVISGLAGFLAAPVRFVSPGMMEQFSLEALAAAVVAGLGSLPGAVLGAFLIGIVTEFANVYLPSEFRALAPLAVIFVALVARPQGLAGQAAERVV